MATIKDILVKEPCVEGYVEALAHFGDSELTTQSIVDWGKHIRWWCLEWLTIEAQDAVIASGNPEWYTEFVRANPDCNIEKLKKLTIKSGDPEWCYYFALFADVAIEPLQDVVLRAGDPEWCYYFAMYIDGSDRAALYAVIRAGGNLYYQARIAGFTGKLTQI